MFTLLFPGQGSQQPGMGKIYYEQFPEFRQSFEEASDSLSIDFKKLCFEGSATDLALTENTQPCLLLVSIATFRVLKKEFSLQVQAAAGHSVGEYAAIVCANALPFAEALKAVRLRGQAMQQAVPVGKGGMMAVIGIENSEVEQLCHFISKKPKLAPLSPANYNSPGQVVISGSINAINFIKESFNAEECFGKGSTIKPRFIELKVSAPFHCEMMMPAQTVMADCLKSMHFSDALFPIVQNLDAQSHTSAKELCENLILQVSSPVRWVQSMELLRSKGLTKTIECGTGKVLQGLLKKIDSKAFQVFNTNSLEDLKLIEAALH